MTDATVTCLCGKCKDSVHIASKLPIESIVCHCDTCRHNLGALYRSSLPLKAPPALSSLDAYHVSPVLTRYFCGTCGSHVYECRRAGDREKWDVQSGVLESLHSEQVFDELEQIKAHEFVGDTQDGGLSLCLTGSLENPVQSFVQVVGSDKVDSSLLQLISDRSTAADRERLVLPASCHCRGVQFYITRPTSASSLASSPWPDLIVPYHAQSSANPKDIKWWIRGDRWLAGTCACRSCRLGLGSPIQAWAFVSHSNLYNNDGSPFSYNLGTIRAFQSSPGVLREFCSHCGATLFWHNDERPGVVDVSVGVLRGSGARVNSWLDWWTGRVSFIEEARQKQLIGTFESKLPCLKLWNEAGNASK